MKKLLIIGRTFPEPNTTAAGSRMMQLIHLFLQDNCKITFVSTASLSKHSADLDNIGIDLKKIALNDDSVDDFLKDLNPNIVIFDRFISEEHFGWRVREQLPNAITILDTEDLHFLRKAREKAVRNKGSFSSDLLYTETTKRELSSILRCDLSLIISEVEYQLLIEEFNIDESILFYLPFLIDTKNIDLPNQTFESRKDFISVGNFYHKPNVDAVIQLKKHIWPLIKQELPNANLHVFGAYAPQQILEMHNEKEGLLIHGWIENIDEQIVNSRLVLAPLRFGAGLKGKLLSAMLNNTPVVTTSIGAEGMYGNSLVPGIIEDNNIAFAKEAVALYTNKELWQEKLAAIPSILEQRFDKKHFENQFIDKVNYLLANQTAHRKNNYLGQLLNYQTQQSTKYLSKWIMEKNK